MKLYMAVTPDRYELPLAPPDLVYDLFWLERFDLYGQCGN